MKEVERVKKIGYVIDEAIGYFTPDISRINHLFKVYSYAKTIGEMENLDEKMQEICGSGFSCGSGAVRFYRLRKKCGG